MFLEYCHLETLPRHLAIIMDGNRRWAAQKGLPGAEGHRRGVEAANVCIQNCLKHGIPMLSLFAFSSENWGRSEEEVAFLMELFFQGLNKYINELDTKGVGLRFTGFRDNLSPVLQEKMREAEQHTAHNKRLLVNVVINYGGRWDIVEATKKIAAQVQQGLPLAHIDEALISRELSTHGLPDPDLFIRTSGEQRISNFFLWQLAYTELYFTPVYWPDFDGKEFDKALESYGQRERRYGKTSLHCSENQYV